jgi:DNA-nicking Smr family endonuclease
MTECWTCGEITHASEDCPHIVKKDAIVPHLPQQQQPQQQQPQQPHSVPQAEPRQQIDAQPASPRTEITPRVPVARSQRPQQQRDQRREQQRVQDFKLAVNGSLDLARLTRLVAAYALQEILALIQVRRCVCKTNVLIFVGNVGMRSYHDYLPSHC